MDYIYIYQNNHVLYECNDDIFSASSPCFMKNANYFFSPIRIARLFLIRILNLHLKFLLYGVKSEIKQVLEVIKFAIKLIVRSAQQC